MNIGEASKRSGLPIKTIRYYEDIGLLIADRRANGYRDYSVNHIRQLAFIKRARDFGFPIEECRQLLALFNNDERASADVKALAKRRLNDLEQKAVEIQELSTALARLVESCHGDSNPDCPIIDDLAQSARDNASSETKRVRDQTKKNNQQKYNQNGRT